MIRKKKKNLLPARSCPFTMQPVSGREKTEMLPNPTIPSIHQPHHPSPLERMAMPQKEKEHHGPSFLISCSSIVNVKNETWKHSIKSVASCVPLYLFLWIIFYWGYFFHFIFFSFDSIHNNLDKQLNKPKI